MLNIQVRQGVFETNSSSTHSISIPCQTSLTIPELIHFEIGEYESLNDGYMDHANELNGFLDAIVANKDMMMRYLFSPYSFILTGSDNDYSYVIDNKAVMEYASDFFYKGN